MSQKISKSLFVIFSLSAVITSCASFSHRGLAVDVCISSPQSHGLECVSKDNTEYLLPYENTENFIALPYQDFEALMNACNMPKP